MAVDLEWMGARAIRRVAGPRRAERLVGRWRGALFVGRRVQCPCCGGRFRHWLPDALGRPSVACPRCLSHPRHRALALYLPRQEFARGRMLHFAPEVALRRTIAGLPLTKYVSVDIDASRADVSADIQSLPFADSAVDFVLCSHVLEHVPDDRAAMAEVLRILAPGGTALFMVPLDQSRQATYEDPDVVTAEERIAAYLQADHMRLYGADFSSRLGSAGFEVRADSWVSRLPAELVARHGLSEADVFFVASRAPGP